MLSPFACFPVNLLSLSKEYAAVSAPRSTVFILTGRCISKKVEMLFLSVNLGYGLAIWDGQWGRYDFQPSPEKLPSSHGMLCGSRTTGRRVG